MDTERRNRVNTKELIRTEEKYRLVSDENSIYEYDLNCVEKRCKERSRARNCEDEE